MINRKDSKQTRVRTVMNEKQIQILRTCYNANPRPDALMKEQLTEMTGKREGFYLGWGSGDSLKLVFLDSRGQQWFSNQFFFRSNLMT